LEEIAQRRASQFVLFLKYRNKKFLRNFARFRASAALKTSFSRRLVFNRRCFRANISHNFFLLLLSFACIIIKLSQVSTEFVSLPRSYGQVKRCYYHQYLLLYMCTALYRLIRTFVETGRTITNTLLEDIHTFIKPLP